MYEWPGLESKEKVKEERKESKHVLFQRSISKFFCLSVSVLPNSMNSIIKFMQIE